MKIKKSVIVFVTIATVTLPMLVGATTMWSGDRYTLPAGETKSGNSYLITKNELIAGTIGGDLVTAGEQIIVTGTVNEDALIVGQKVQLTGVVKGDARVASGDVLVLGTIGGDLVAAGGKVYAAPNSSVGGDIILVGGDTTLEGAANGRVRISGGEVFINGPIIGSLDVESGRLTLGERAVIGGDLNFRGPQAPVIAPGAVIKGKTVYNRDDFGSERFSRFAGGIGAVAAAVLLAMYLLLSILFFGLFRAQATSLTHDALRETWSSFGRGIIAALLFGAFSGVAAITIVGLPLAAFGILSLGLLTLIASALSGVVFGTWAMRVIFKRPQYHPTMATAIWGAIFIRLFALIPFVGGLITIFFFLLAFGVLANAVYRRFWLNR